MYITSDVSPGGRDSATIAIEGCVREGFASADPDKVSVHISASHKTGR